MRCRRRSVLAGADAEGACLAGLRSIDGHSVDEADRLLAPTILSRESSTLQVRCPRPQGSTGNRC